MTQEQIDRALKFYEAHKSYISSILRITKEEEEPPKPHYNVPGTWNGYNWLWFFRNIIQPEPCNDFEGD